jgi:hypothetical protein
MNINHLYVDRIGAGLSLLCLVHCIMTAVLVSILPVLAGFGHFHYWLLLFLLPVAGIAIYNAACKHRKKGIAGLILSGILIIVFATLLLHGLIVEIPVMIAGSSMLVYGHYLNHQACKKCHHSHAAHDRSPEYLKSA